MGRCQVFGAALSYQSDWRPEWAQRIWEEMQVPGNPAGQLASADDAWLQVWLPGLAMPGSVPARCPINHPYHNLFSYWGAFAGAPEGQGECGAGRVQPAQVCPLAWGAGAGHMPAPHAEPCLSPSQRATASTACADDVPRQLAASSAPAPPHPYAPQAAGGGAAAGVPGSRRGGEPAGPGGAEEAGCGLACRGGRGGALGLVGWHVAVCLCVWRVPGQGRRGEMQAGEISPGSFQQLKQDVPCQCAGLGDAAGHHARQTQRSRLAQHHLLLPHRRLSWCICGWAPFSTPAGPGGHQAGARRGGLAILCIQAPGCAAALFLIPYGWCCLSVGVGAVSRMGSDERLGGRHRTCAGM